MLAERTGPGDRADGIEVTMTTSRIRDPYGSFVEIDEHRAP
jgi:hypothetical protein